jgi:hypothetical protein
MSKKQGHFEIHKPYHRIAMRLQKRKIEDSNQEAQNKHHKRCKTTLSEKSDSNKTYFS